MIGGCQVNVEWRSRGRTGPSNNVVGQMHDSSLLGVGQAGFKSSNVVHGQIRACNAAKELETAGTESQKMVSENVRMLCRSNYTRCRW